jgi:hypothetical protein
MSKKMNELLDGLSPNETEDVMNFMYVLQDIVDGINNLETKEMREEAMRLFELQYMLQAMFNVDFPSLKLKA